MVQKHMFLRQRFQSPGGLAGQRDSPRRGGGFLVRSVRFAFTPGRCGAKDQRAGSRIADRAAAAVLARVARVSRYGAIGREARERPRGWDTAIRGWDRFESASQSIEQVARRVPTCPECPIGPLHSLALQMCDPALVFLLPPIRKRYGQVGTGF